MTRTPPTIISLLFQAGTVRGRGRTIAGSRAPGSRGSYLGGYSAGRGIYSRYHEGKGKQQEKPYELLPSLELAAVNPVGIKPCPSQCEPSYSSSLSSSCLPLCSTTSPHFIPLTVSCPLLETFALHRRGRNSRPLPPPACRAQLACQVGRP